MNRIIVVIARSDKMYPSVTYFLNDINISPDVFVPGGRLYKIKSGKPHYYVPPVGCLHSSSALPSHSSRRRYSKYYSYKVPGRGRGFDYLTVQLIFLIFSLSLFSMISDLYDFLHLRFHLHFILFSFFLFDWTFWCST
jgi:hypothetical protein